MSCYVLYACMSYRSERMCVATNSGEFVAVIDFEGFQFSKCPPLSVLISFMGLLKYHFPYRIAGMYIVNTGTF